MPPYYFRYSQEAIRKFYLDFAAQVRALPTLLVVKGGDVKAKLVGLQNKALLVAALVQDGEA